MTWTLIIPAIALGVSFFSIGLELLMRDKEKAQEIEFSIIRKNREVKKFKKENDTKAMMKAQKELMGLSGQKMRLNMHAMIISLPVFLLLWWAILGPALGVGPLVAGETSMVGVELRNLASTPQDLGVELVSQGIEVRGVNNRSITLDDKGDEGDWKQLWWNVSASEGAKSYSIKITSGEQTQEVNYNVRFVSKDAMSADFSPAEMKEENNLQITPKYRTTMIDLGFWSTEWNMFYILSFFILLPITTPIKNRILWGHRKGVKHLEKKDNEKQALGAGEHQESN